MFVLKRAGCHVIPNENGLLIRLFSVSDMASNNISTAAEKRVSPGVRWDILKQAVLNQPREMVYGHKSVSVRSFEGYSLFKKQFILSPLMHGWSSMPPHTDIDRVPGRWYAFSSTHEEYCNLSVKVKLLTGAVAKQDMVGFDNTGNICVWPAEEVLAYLMLTLNSELKDLSICELGGGMTGFAGLVAAISQQPKLVLLSDGNELSVDNCRVVIEGNAAQLVGTRVECDVIKWGDRQTYHKRFGQFDLVIAADCLFFDDVHSELINTISDLLREEGKAILLAPYRGNTLETFCELAKQFFTVRISDNYDQLIWDKHISALNLFQNSYKSGLHYPILITLLKK